MAGKFAAHELTSCRTALPVIVSNQHFSEEDAAYLRLIFVPQQLIKAYMRSLNDSVPC